ncbi:MAG: peptidoglycan-binding protein, partial [Myxococcota bacterium]|nr:peptidoglycan-binding protein [Myxococcota bacterium]
IYPGNRVRFFQDGDESPTQVETGEGPQAVSELEGVEPGSEFVSDEPDDTVQVVGKIGPTLNRDSMVVRDVFVTPREIEEAGVIEASFSEATMLTFLDEMYVKFKQGGGRIGDRYLIFRTEAEIQHPRKGGRVGYMTRILGTARIIRVSDRVSTMRIEQAWDEIRRGDLIGPYGEQLNDRVASRPADRKLEGFVVAAANPHLTMMAEYHTIVLDKGSADGVQVGHEFVVTRRGNEGGKFTNPWEVVGRNDYPWEDIGVCMAVDVKETASTCLIKRSLREIVPGDRVETRPQGGGAVSQR